MFFRTIAKDRLPDLVRGLATELEVVGPVAKGGKYVLAPIDDPADLRLDYDTTLLPPLAKAGVTLPSRNPFCTNVLQAVEIVDAAERCAGYIERLLETGGSSAPVAFKVAAGEGSGATEAPRGTLYHGYAVDDDGLITRGDVITPTAQNLANLDADMRLFAPTVADRPRDEFVLLVEELVRAYDPCLSCAVH